MQNNKLGFFNSSHETNQFETGSVVIQQDQLINQNNPRLTLKC